MSTAAVGGGGRAARRGSRPTSSSAVLAGAAISANAASNMAGNVAEGVSHEWHTASQSISSAAHDVGSWFSG